MIVNKAVILNAGVRGFAAILAFASQIMMVKLLGEFAYGSYALFVTYCSLIYIFSRSGLDVVSLRSLSVAFGNLDRAQFIHVLKKALLLAALFSLGWVLLFSLLKQAGALGQIVKSTASTGWILASVFGMTLLAVLMSAARGMRRIISADFVDSIAKPAVILLLIWLFSLAGFIGSSAGYAAFVAANLISAGLATALLISAKRNTPWTEANPPATKTTLLTSSSAAIFIAYALITYVFFQLDTLIVGATLGVVEAGAYNMASNFVRLVIFIPMIVLAQVQPFIASRFHAGDTASIKETVFDALKKSLFFAASGVAILLMTGRWLLSFVSPAFTGAYPALAILSFAHLLNSGILVISGVLLMCRAQNIVVTAQVAGLLICLPLYLILIPKYGTTGAAASVFFGLAINLTCLILLSARWIARKNSK